ncbi:hypothetical protein Dimus_038544 [Dionaea muscipula]
MTAPVTWEGVSQIVSIMMDCFLQDLQTCLPQLTLPVATIEERAPVAPERRIPTRAERGKFAQDDSAPQPSPTEVQHNPQQPRQTSSQRRHLENHPVLPEDDEDKVDELSYTAMENLAGQQAAFSTLPPTSGLFTQDVLCFPFPPGLRLPHFEQYDGSTDPEDHVSRFEIKMQLFNVDDPVMCRTFPSTFKGAARKWYASLTLGSISRFSQLRDAFIGHFASSCAFSRAAPSLFSIRQRPDESLRKFMARFNKTYIQIPGLSGEVAAVTLQTGLRPGVFTDDLILHPPRNFEKLLQRARSYMSLEDQNEARAALDTSSRAILSGGMRPDTTARTDAAARRRDPRGGTSASADSTVPRGTSPHG